MVNLKYTSSGPELQDEKIEASIQYFQFVLFYNYDPLRIEKCWNIIQKYR